MDWLVARQKKAIAKYGIKDPSIKAFIIFDDVIADQKAIRWSADLNSFFVEGNFSLNFATRKLLLGVRKQGSEMLHAPATVHLAADDRRLVLLAGCAQDVAALVAALRRVGRSLTRLAQHVRCVAVAQVDTHPLCSTHFISFQLTCLLPSG